MFVLLLEIGLLAFGMSFLGYSIRKNWILYQKYRDIKNGTDEETVYGDILCKGYIPQRYRNGGKGRDVEELTHDILKYTDYHIIFSEEFACGFPKELERRIEVL